MNIQSTFERFAVLGLARLFVAFEVVAIDRVVFCPDGAMQCLLGSQENTPIDGNDLVHIFQTLQICTQDGLYWVLISSRRAQLPHTEVRYTRRHPSPALPSLGLGFLSVWQKFYTRILCSSGYVHSFS